MHKAIFRILSVSAAGFLFCGMAFAQQSSAPSAQQQPPASKPATTTKPATTAAKKPAAPAPKTLETQKDKVSYAIGLNLGKSLDQNIKRDSVDIDPELIIKGLRDGMSGGQALLTDQEVQSVLAALQADVRKRQQEQFQQALVKNKKEGDEFLQANKGKPGVVALPSGLQYKVIQTGDGPKPTAGDTVVCNYRGTLIDGTEFDSSYKRGQPATFPVGQVIKGWTEALQLMPVGSKWELYIPSELAYGERGTPNGGPIGPDETLIFQVELLSIQQKPAPKLEAVPGSGQPAVPAQPQAKPETQPQGKP